jgi:uncharacterized OB-fold protein
MNGAGKVREVQIPMDASYRWSVGAGMEKFFSELGRGQIVGVKCPRCNRVFVPPRMICEYCFAETGEWMELGSLATVTAFTVAYVEVDGAAGGLRDLEEPRIIALIQPEGADSAFVHRVGEISPEEMRVGMKVEAVWSGEPHGDLFDLLYFRPAG